MVRKTLLLVLGIILASQCLGMMGMAFAENKPMIGLIVVDPGSSGFSLKVAENIKGKLQTKNIPAKIVKAKSFRTSDLQGIELLVMGGPTYAAQPSGGLKKALAKIHEPGLKTLLFQTGGRDCAGLKPLIELAAGKGLEVVGSSGILFNKRDPGYMDEMVDRLLETI